MASSPALAVPTGGRPCRKVTRPAKGGGLWRGSLFAAVVLSILAFPALAASDKQPAPAGSLPDAPAQYTEFTPAELTRGFLALAFGSDLRIGARPMGLRRFNHPITATVVPRGSVDRTAAMRGVLEDYARSVPALGLHVVGRLHADVEVRLIDEKDFDAALVGAFGKRIAREFIKRTDPQCMTSVRSNAKGEIEHAVSFVIVDKGEDVFRDCAYHELLHAFGLSNHDQKNPYTTLNQDRMVGYLSVYDRDLLSILYDPRVKPGISRAKARKVLPVVIRSRGLAK